MGLFHNPHPRRWVDAQMEAWGNSAFAVVLLAGLPLFFYYLAGPEPALVDIERITAAVKDQRIVVEKSGGDDDMYLELVLEGVSLPVRFHEPVMGLEPAAALNARPFADAKPGRATVAISRRDRPKLASPPFYPPHRWIEGYGLEAGGKVYLETAAAVEFWAKDWRGMRWAAHITVFLEVALLLGVLSLWWDERHPAEPEQPVCAPAREDPAEKEAARRDSFFYYVFLPGSMLFNVLALVLRPYTRWAFGPLYWLFFCAAAAGLQALFYLHHRRSLSILDSLPRSRGERPGSFLSYLILTVMLCVMLTPAIQLAFSLFNTSLGLHG